MNAIVSSGASRNQDANIYSDNKVELPLRFLITAGGTAVPVDQVRELTNGSEGTTGALIAQTALKHGNAVHYLCSKRTVTPFQRELSIDWQQPVESEIARVTDQARSLVPILQGNLSIERTTTFDQYLKAFEAHANSGKVDVLIASMAASDYGPKPVEGKISSDADGLVLNLHPLPKIISLAKKERDDLFLVGFKLLVAEPPDVLIEKAYKNLVRDKQDLAVANVGPKTMKPTEMFTYLLTAERCVVPIKRAELPETLHSLIEQRFSRNHFTTVLDPVFKLPIRKDVAREFIGDLDRLSKLCLFTPYLKGSTEESGFLAKRVPAGTLITTRGSSKSEATVKDLAVVTDLDKKSKEIFLSSLGKKASLDAPLAHLIFEARPEVNYILHSHIAVPGAAHTDRSTTPGTIEDWENLKELVQAGENVITQLHHGVLILGSSVNEILDTLERCTTNDSAELQMINHIAPEDLIPFFERAYRDLKPGEVFEFDSCKGDDFKESMRATSREKSEDEILLTHRGNLIEERKERCSERSEIFNTKTGEYSLTYNLKSSWNYAKEELIAVLDRVQFSKVRCKETARSIHFSCSK